MRRVMAAVLATTGLAVLGPSAQAATAQERPSVVLVVVDDASVDLMRGMRSVSAMERRGAAYTSAYVVDSLCCVSRTTLLTGQYPHQTGVRTNLANSARKPVGGWAAFRRYGNGARSVNVRLRRSGYTTGFVGKFLNEYNPRGGRPPAVPPGWSEFLPVFESAYDQWDFGWGRSRDGERMRLRRRTAPPASASRAVKDRAYAGRFVQRTALDFIERHRDEGRPYFLEVAPYAPHGQVGPSVYRREPFFPPMFRHRPSSRRPQGDCGSVRCGSLSARELPGWRDPRADNRPRRADGSLGPTWQRPSRTSLRSATTDLRNRARMMQSVDEMVLRILDAVGEDTYVILTSDNGFHLGQWGLRRGKGTAYRTDVQVPLLVVGPGTVPGVRRGMVSNLDIAPTLEELAGIRTPDYRAGTSFVPSLTDPAAADRRFAFVDHTWSGTGRRDPDGGDAELATIPSYLAVRSRTGLLVRYDFDRGRGTSYAWEFYDYTDSRGERTNTVHRRAKRVKVRALKARLRDFDSCRRYTRDEALPARCRGLTR